MEKHCLLACSHGSLCLLSYTPQDHLPRGSTTHGGYMVPSLLNVCVCVHVCVCGCMCMCVQARGQPQMSFLKCLLFLFFSFEKGSYFYSELTIFLTLAAQQAPGLRLLLLLTASVHCHASIFM